MLIAAAITNPDFEKTDFEFRYWITDVLGDFARELFMVQHSKDSSWHLTHYQLCYDADKHNYTVISKKDSTLAGWDTQWNKLLSFNLPSLPDERKAEKMENGRQWDNRNS